MRPIVFIRVDASLEMGTGHVMRCLTLAKELRNQQCDVTFVCREHTGNMIAFIEENGFTVYPLVTPPKENAPIKNQHSRWLHATIEQDVEATRQAMESELSARGCQIADLVIVDHYALDDTWEAPIKDYTHELLAIDDLADRNHACDILLDQTFLRNKSDYQQLTPDSCKILTGAEYTLLRSEFIKARQASLERDRFPIQNILISMGGVDKDNITLDILQQLVPALSSHTQVTVLLGNRNPWESSITEFIDRAAINAKVIKSTSKVAELLAETDLVIGASGTSSWERCCLGIPTIMFVIASNQEFLAKQLQNAGAVVCATLQANDSYDIGKCLSSLTPAKVAELSHTSSQIVDGLGLQRVISQLSFSQ